MNVRVPLTVAAAAALALLVWAGYGIDRASAHEPHPGLQFSIAIQGVTACDTRYGDATCAIPAGATFRIGVSLHSLPADIPSYQGFDIELNYVGVTPLQDASNAAWPDCVFPASYYDDGFIGFGCAIGVAPVGPGPANSSRYTGLIGTNSFVCAQSGSVTLLYGAEVGYTDLVESVTQQGDDQIVVSHAEGDGTAETINISCGEPPTPGPTRVLLPSTGQQGPARDSTAVWPWLIAMLVAIGAALTVPAMLLIRRHR